MKPIKECDLACVRRIAHYCEALAFKGGLVVRQEAQAMKEAVEEIEERRKAMGIAVKPAKTGMRTSLPKDE